MGNIVFVRNYALANSSIIFWECPIFNSCWSICGHELPLRCDLSHTNWHYRLFLTLKLRQSQKHADSVDAYWIGHGKQVFALFLLGTQTFWGLSSPKTSVLKMVKCGKGTWRYMYIYSIFWMWTKWESCCFFTQGQGRYIIYI